MRSIFLALPFILAADLAAQSPVACGRAALDAAEDTWDADSVVAGDFTLDGSPDVAFWKREDASVLVFIVACDRDRAVETWRFRVALEGDSGEKPVRVVTPLLDADLVDRVCGGGESDECLHMRQENSRRQAILNAGGRELWVGGAANGVRFRWSRDAHGFMRIAG